MSYKHYVVKTMYSVLNSILEDMPLAVKTEKVQSKPVDDT